MKFSISFKYISILLLAFTALFAAPSAHAGDEITLAAVTNWITQKAKNNVTPAEAAKITRAVFQQARDPRIDPFLVVSMIYAESTFHPKAKSPMGARGLMQVMPRWHADKIGKRNIFDIQTNIEVGLKILQDCLLKTKDRVTSGLKCYSGGASGKYERRIAQAHQSLKQAVIVARFEHEAPITSVATMSKPRFWHDQLEDYERIQMAARREEEIRRSAQQYEQLIIAAMIKPPQPYPN